ncbi:MAG: winged helix-turn-helix domain-containing protein [Rhodospirillales bacterium]
MGIDVADIERDALDGNPSWTLVQRISASASFQNSPRLRQLLLYLCERALLNRPDDLREQLIGCNVFLRKPDYNPGEDNVVRVQIRRLRKRLDEYFNSEGRDEPIIISIPKGSYVPVFLPRELSQVEAPAAPAAAALGRRYQPAALVAAAIALLGIGFLAGLWQAGAAASAAEADWSPLWPAIFNSNEKTLIVCADSTLVMAQALTRRPLSLDDYESRHYVPRGTVMGEEAERILKRLPAWTWTDLADVRLVGRLRRVTLASWDRMSIRTAKTVRIHDFTSGNAIILGSAQSNPWNALFEPQLNFRVEWDVQKDTARVRNKSPLPGEQPVYPPIEGGDRSVVYSVIAFIPNLRRSGNILIIAGTTGQATETAGEHLTNPATYTQLMRMITSRNGGELPYFEVLLKSSVVERIAKDAQVVAFRILSPGPKAAKPS